MDLNMAIKHGDTSIIKMLNSIHATTKTEFYRQLSNKTSETNCSPHRKARIRELAKIRLQELLQTTTD